MHNVQDAPARSGVAVSAVLGHADAERLLSAIHDDSAPADALYEAIGLVAATGDADRLRAFARGVQKRIEAASQGQGD